MWIKRASKGVIAAVAAVTALCSAPLQAIQMLAPDADGYRLIDSNERYGPKFDYKDISGTGSLLYERSREFGCNKENDVTDADTPGKLGDDSSVSIRFGFPFKFYGQIYYTAQVSSNGYISFGDSTNNYGCAPTDPNCAPKTIPQSGNTPGWQTPPFVAPWFDDLDPGAGGAVYCEIQGLEQLGSRRVVVQWKDVAHHNDPAAKFDFQAVLYEGSNQVLFQYNKSANEPTSFFDNGASATIGIQGSDDAGIDYKVAGGTLANDLAIGFIPASGDYVGIPASAQEVNGAPGQVMTYQVEAFNGKSVESEFKIEQLSGSLWQVEIVPPAIVTIPSGESKSFTVKVTVPAEGSAALDDDIVTFKVTDKVKETTTVNDGSNGSSTNTQNNEVIDRPVDGIPEIKSIFSLKTRCDPASCAQQDSDGDGVADSSEAASSVNDAAAINGLAVLSGATLDVKVGINVQEKDKDGKVVATTFQACASPGCAFYGFAVEDAVNGPEGIEFAMGVFNYRIIPNRFGESAIVRFTLPTPLAEKPLIYNVDSSGKFTEIDKDEEIVAKKRWKRVDANTLELQLADGSGLDGDGAINGVIVNRLAIGATAVPKDTGDGFGSGSLSSELLLLVALAGMRRRARRFVTL